MASTTPLRHQHAISGSWLAARRGVDPALIDAMRRDGELLAFREPASTEWRYPAWQFDGWKPRPGVVRIVKAAEEAGLDEARLYDLLTAPLGLVGGDRRTLVDLLREGRVDEIVAAIRTAGARPRG